MLYPGRFILVESVIYLPYFQDIDMFKICQMDKMLVVNMICVAPEETGKGLSYQMMQWTEKKAIEKGLKVITSETTGRV